MGVSGGLSTGVELGSFFSLLGLFDVQITAHVLASVLGDGGVNGSLVSHFDEGHSFGTSGVTVGQKVAADDSAELTEESFDVVLLGVVRETRDTEFENFIGSSSHWGGLGELNRLLLGEFDGFLLGSLLDFFGRFFFGGRFDLDGGLLHSLLGGLDFFFGRFFFGGRFDFLGDLLGGGSLLDLGRFLLGGFDDFFGRFFFGGRFDLLDGGLLGRGGLLGGLDLFGRFFVG
jgi:hypothetical protein